MTQEREPSILEYARYYGLSRNHLEVNPLEVLPPPDDSILQLDDESLWLQLSAQAASPQAERLVAVKEASALLATTDPRQYEGCNFEGVDKVPTHRIRDIKHELPLLRTDHEMDMLNFVHHIDPNLADEFFPFEKVDDEQDEGLRWPSRCHELPELLFHKAQNEKLGIAKGVLEYVKGVLDMDVQEGNEPTFEYELPTYTRVRHLFPPDQGPGTKWNSRIDFEIRLRLLSFRGRPLRGRSNPRRKLAISTYYPIAQVPRGERSKGLIENCLRRML